MGNYPEYESPWDDDMDSGWLPRNYHDPDDKPLFAKEPRMTDSSWRGAPKGWTDRRISGYGSAHEDAIADTETAEQTKNTVGYHTTPIVKGVFGEPSKIKEEVDEFLDALGQDATLMALHELSDLYGAIEGYLEKHHPAFSMLDLKKMSDITKRAFKVGHRT